MPRAAPGLTCVLSTLLMLSGIIGAQNGYSQSRVDEYRVKAAFLTHFAQLVDWPAEALSANNDALTICTIGEDPFHGALDTAAEGKLVGSHPLRARHASQPSELAGCHIVFIGANEAKRSSLVLTSLQNTSALAVGESDDFLHQGGAIRFCVEENKIRFEINLQAAERAKLKISSRLLLLAKTVIGSHAQG